MAVSQFTRRNRGRLSTVTRKCFCGTPLPIAIYETCDNCRVYGRDCVPIKVAIDASQKIKVVLYQGPRTVKLVKYEYWADDNHWYEIKTRVFQTTHHQDVTREFDIWMREHDLELVAQRQPTAT